MYKKFYLFANQEISLTSNMRFVILRYMWSLNSAVYNYNHTCMERNTGTRYWENIM